jgi:hypothetical protein
VVRRKRQKTVAEGGVGKDAGREETETHDFAAENLLVLVVEEGKRIDGGRL